MQEELSVIETTRRLGVGIDATYKLIYAGKLAAHKIDGRWRISASVVEARLRAQAERRRPTASAVKSESAGR